MLAKRIIPVLLLKDSGFYKTVRFRKPKYIGDPINTIRLFNDKGVDELIILDIEASLKKKINFNLLSSLAGEAFIPLGYGGGIRSVKDAESVFKLGYEKIIVNTLAFSSSSTVQEMVNHFGRQSIVVSLDVKSDLLYKETVRYKSGKINTKRNVVDVARSMEDLGVGEIMINDINREGTWSGFNLDMISRVSEAVNIPVIACGGASDYKNIEACLKSTSASAAAAGSLFVYQKKDSGVLINYRISSIQSNF